MLNKSRERMSIVIVGHVDHGKSTVIGRLLADTNSLPFGKLDQVRKMCEKNSRPFEYAFLLDALKDEQAQGITIDTARCFFKTKKRDYIVLDAPGHIEFLKNMVTGAARAEAAFIVIDAKEGIQENSKRHGQLFSMLGIKQFSVLINKMDLVGYSEEIFYKLASEYQNFLSEFHLKPLSVIPISARLGENILHRGENLSWYKGLTVVEQLDAFDRDLSEENMPFRFPVQDVYKFTAQGDDRRIIAGTIETGKINVGDDVVLLPSYKTGKIKSIEQFNSKPKKSAFAGESIGFTLDLQIYIKPGELIVKSEQKLPYVSNRFKANIFWMGRSPLVKNKIYKLKLSSSRLELKLREIVDSSEHEVKRHHFAECIFETTKPAVFDLSHEILNTARFVIVDNYEIAGCGIILDAVYDEDKNSIALDLLDEKNVGEKHFLPINVNVKNKKILVVGGGKVAFQKLKTIVKFSKNITVIGKKISDDIKNLHVKHIERSFLLKDLNGYNLVFICTNDKKLNKKISKKAQEKGVLVNVADDISLCDFISPAVGFFDDLVISVSSNGKDVKGAVCARDLIISFLKKQNYGS